MMSLKWTNLAQKWMTICAAGAVAWSPMMCFIKSYTLVFCLSRSKNHNVDDWVLWNYELQYVLQSTLSVLADEQLVPQLWIVFRLAPLATGLELCCPFPVLFPWALLGCAPCWSAGQCQGTARIGSLGRKQCTNHLQCDQMPPCKVRDEGAGKGSGFISPGVVGAAVEAPAADQYQEQCLNAYLVFIQFWSHLFSFVTDSPQCCITASVSVWVKKKFGHKYFICPVFNTTTTNCSLDLYLQLFAEN